MTDEIITTFAALDALCRALGENLADLTEIVISSKNGDLQITVTSTRERTEYPEGMPIPARSYSRVYS